MGNCEIVHCHSNLNLHWISSADWFASRGYEIWHSLDQGASWRLKGILKVSRKRWAAGLPLLAQSLRLGIHNLIRLASGTLICIADGTVYRSLDEGSTFAPVLSGFNGYRVLRNGICQDNTGRIYMGEYWLNKECRDVRLWRSEDDGRTWGTVHTWTPGTARHIHLVQFDPYEETLWVGTGDRDAECQMLCSRDGGVTFEPIGAGTQDWRAVSVLFTPEAVLWGTDIGMGEASELNYIVRWDRSTRTLRQLAPLVGPAYYSTVTAQGTLVIGTAVERGGNQKDNYVHLYWLNGQGNWNNARLWRKWPLPGVLGPATITFPLGSAPAPRLLFNANLVLSRYNGALAEAVLRPR